MQQTGSDSGGDGSLTFPVDSSVYCMEAIVATAHLFTDRCYVNLASEGYVTVVHIVPKEHCRESKQLFLEFHNELLDQQLRAQLRKETGEIQRMIISEAFAPLEQRSDE